MTINFKFEYDMMLTALELNVWKHLENLTGDGYKEAEKLAKVRNEKEIDALQDELRDIEKLERKLRRFKKEVLIDLLIAEKEERLDELRGCGELASEAMTDFLEGLEDKLSIKEQVMPHLECLKDKIMKHS